VKTCLTILSFVLLIVLAQPPVVHSATNMLFILDASNSMWGQVDGISKIKTAKTVFNSLLRDLPTETKVGLMAYGLKSKDDCQDIEVLSKIGSEHVNSLITKVNSINPMGKTPIATSLEQSIMNFEGIEEENNHVVLISDGIETCGGDPCQAVLALMKRGIQMKIHVVGFDVSNEERKQLECIAQNGNGQYLQASNAEGLKTALGEVKKVVQETPKPERTIYFHDDFDGDDLSEHWEIINPDPDSFIVENGELLMINSTGASFAGENIGNLFNLSKPLPEGDWTATAKITVDFQSRLEQVFFGLYADKENYLVSILNTGYDGNHGRHYLFVSPTKASKGAITHNRAKVWGTERVANKSNDLFTPAMAKGQPILLRLEKKGREYISSIKMTGVEKPEWNVLPGLKMLRPKGNIAVGVFQSHTKQGETTVKVDWIKIEVLGEPK